jgi:hypothetical protein
MPAAGSLDGFHSVHEGSLSEVPTSTD